MGRDLSEQVASKILQGDDLAYRHRDYCGIGIFRAGWAPTHHFDLGKQVQGQLVPSSDFEICYVIDGYPSKRITSFQGKDAFVNWLSAQSDYSMSGCFPNELYEEAEPFNMNNQRITRERLTNFVQSVFPRPGP